MEFNITDSEWKILEILWDKPGCLIGEIKNSLYFTGWSYSTIKTLVSRLVKKEVLRVEDSNSGKMYYPVLQKDKCQRRETKHFIDKIYNGSVSMMMSNLVKKSSLSKKEAKKLMELIDKMED